MSLTKPYQIIPRRFRPTRFSEVVGHAAVVTTLKNALAFKTIGQAYLLCGGRGCGKTTLARLFAKALTCSHLSHACEPCNQCTSCREITDGRSLDVIEIDGASNRGIDDIRRLTETVGYAPQSSPFKIYIIDEVHMLTKEAFNALLKTLEEPPEQVKFFFATTEPHRIPPTILSRCQRFNLMRIPDEIVVEKLRRITDQLGIEIEQAALWRIGKLAEGSLRDGESLLDQLICFGKAPITEAHARDLLGLPARKHLEAIDEAIAHGDTDQAMAIGKTLYETGRDIGACIDHLLEHFRDHLTELKQFDKTQCLNILETLIEWQQQLAKTPFKRIHMEMCLAALVKGARRISLDALIERLLQLETHIPIDGGTELSKTTHTSSASIQPQPKETPQAAPALRPEKAPEPSQQPPEEPASSSQPRVVAQKTAEPLIVENPSASRYETLIRFAAVELEGTVSNG